MRNAGPLGFQERRMKNDRRTEAVPAYRPEEVSFNGNKFLLLSFIKT